MKTSSLNLWDAGLLLPSPSRGLLRVLRRNSARTDFGGAISSAKNHYPSLRTTIQKKNREQPYNKKKRKREKESKIKRKNLGIF